MDSESEGLRKIARVQKWAREAGISDQEFSLRMSVSNMMAILCAGCEDPDGDAPDPRSLSFGFVLGVQMAHLRPEWGKRMFYALNPTKGHRAETEEFAADIERVLRFEYEDQPDGRVGIHYYYDPTPWAKGPGR